MIGTPAATDVARSESQSEIQEKRGTQLVYRIHRSVLVAACAGALWGQTQVDLRTQSKSIDFTGANATKPFKSGTLFPVVCSTGEIFYKADAPAGSNVYACTTTNTWTLEQGGGYPAPGGNSGKVLTTDGSTLLFSPLGGDISGPVTAASVTQIQGRPVSSTAPASGQALAWNASTNRWEPQTVSGGGGGGGTGASMTSQLGDFAVIRTSASTLSIGANCSSGTPCNVRSGSMAYSFASGATVTIPSGSGAAYIYVSSGALMVGHNLALSCSGNCVAQSGVASFPADSVPLFLWSATNGAWDTAGGTDLRAFMGTKVVQPGAGMTSTETSGITTLGIDPAVIGARVAVPGSSASACIAGSWASDGSFYYLCVSSGSWRRVALSSF